MPGSATSIHTDVRKDRSFIMSLTRTDKERLIDSRMKLQSVARSLENIDPSKIPHLEEIQECLEDAGESLTGALYRPE